MKTEPTVQAFGARSPDAPDVRAKVLGSTDVLSVKVREPQFEGQTKTKLGNTEIRSYVQKTLNQKLPEWL